jgi:hypothetical protein
VWQYTLVFDKDLKRAAAYPTRPDVAAEMKQAFDRWMGSFYQPRRSSVHYIHHAAFWFFLAGDRLRLKRALDLTGKVFCEQPWNFAGKAPVKYSQAVQAAAGGAFPPPLMASFGVRFLFGLTRFLRAYGRKS